MKLDDDHFTLFGLPARFALDRAQVDARWRALQTEVHPDRFAAQGPAAQRVAMQWAVRVNEAYRRLKDPLARAAYLCEHRGAPIAAESNTAMPADFLMQQMAWREALADARSGAEVQGIDADVALQERMLFERVQQQLDGHGVRDAEVKSEIAAKLKTDPQRDTAAAANTVRALMFVAKFRQDIQRRLEALEA